MPQPKHIHFQFEITCSVKNGSNRARVKVLTRFPPPHMQCKETPKPARPIYDVPAAQRKVVDQTCHSRAIRDKPSTRKQAVHVSI